MASRWGEARFGRCDYSEVIELGMNALQLGPGPADREVHALLAEAYKRKGDDEKAREHVRQSLPSPEEIKNVWRARMQGGHKTLLVVDETAGGSVTEAQQLRAEELQRAHTQKWETVVACEFGAAAGIDAAAAARRRRRRRRRQHRVGQAGRRRRVGHVQRGGWCWWDSTSWTTPECPRCSYPLRNAGSAAAETSLGAQ